MCLCWLLCSLAVNRDIQSSSMKKIEQHFSYYTATTDFITGVSSYSDSFVSAYAREFPNHRVVFHTNAKQDLFPQCKHCRNLEFAPMPAKGRLPFKLAVLVRLAGLAWRLRKNSRPLVSTSPFVSPLPFCPQILTIHDLYDVDRAYRSWHNVLYFKLYYALSRLFADRVIAVSDTTRELAVPHIGSLARSALVLKEASRFVPLEDKSITVPTGPARLLMICNVHVTKNFGAALDILLEARNRGTDFTLDWVGKDTLAIARAEIDARGGPDQFPNLNLLGSVPEQRLEELYATADALLVTSWTEGFCLPVLEAQSKGCPVVASDIPVLREVAGPDSFFFPPRDPKVGVDRIEALLGATDRLGQRLAAVKNARAFDWATGARTLEEAIS